MTTTKERTTKATRTKVHIIEQAAHLFNTKGYVGTSMKDIMKATGLSKGGLYGNFQTKEAIAIAAFDHAVDKVWTEVRQRTKMMDNPLDKLREVVAFYRERVLNPPIEGGCPIQNTAVDASDSNPALKTRVKEVVDLWQQRIMHTLEQGKEKKQVLPKVDTKQFAIQFIGTVEGGILLAQLYQDITYFDTVATQLHQMINQINP
ncbi:MAG: TetR/AcrR family transcriptional regulator [Bacteroidota bacterium]